MVKRNIIEELAEEELVDANEKHDPKFNSTHEAYAVLLEEVEEATADLKLLEQCMSYLWDGVKQDLDCLTVLDAIESSAIHAVQELIQVVAMAKKAKDSELY